MILLKPFKANILSSLAISWSVFTYLLVMAYIFLLFSMSKVFFFFGLFLFVFWMLGAVDMNVVGCLGFAGFL